jgi:hypothetical protein
MTWTRKPSIIRLADRVIGDDWAFHATTVADTSDYGALNVEIRYGTFPTAELLAGTDAGTVVTTGVGALGIPATSFSASGADLWIHVPRATTVNARSATVFMQVSVEADSLYGRTTIGTFQFDVVAQVAVE